MTVLEKLDPRNIAKPQKKRGPPLGNKNACKLPPEFPAVNLNTIDGVNKALKILVQLTWEKRINNRTAAEIHSQLKLIKECLYSEIQDYTDEEIILLYIQFTDELKSYREQLIEHFLKFVEEDPPIRWANSEVNDEYADEIFLEFSNSLPEKLKVTILRELEKEEQKEN